MLEPIQITIIMLFFLYKKLLYMMYNTLNTLNLKPHAHPFIKGYTE